MLGEIIDVARDRGLSFVLLGVFSWNVPAFRLYSNSGFREVVHLKKSSLRVMMLPIDFVGGVVYKVFCFVTSLLPNLFWTYAAQWVHDRTISEEWEV
jgi:hypothetical protein